MRACLTTLSTPVVEECFEDSRFLSPVSLRQCGGIYAKGLQRNWFLNTQLNWNPHLSCLTLGILRFFPFKVAFHTKYKIPTLCNTSCFRAPSSLCFIPKAPCGQYFTTLLVAQCPSSPAPHWAYTVNTPALRHAYQCTPIFLPGSQFFSHAKCSPPI